jgi:hypothetical protein
LTLAVPLFQLLHIADVAWSSHGTACDDAGTGIAEASCSKALVKQLTKCYGISSNIHHKIKEIRINNFVAPTSPTSSGRSVGIVRSWTQAMEFFLVF